MPVDDANAIFSLAGRTALVTGASSGLGRRFAAVLAAHGARVACAARRLDLLEELAGEIAGDGGTALAVRMDVTDEASIVAGFDAAEAALGTVDVVVNNAGVGWRRLATDIEMDEWRGLMRVNVDGVFRVAQEAARRLIAAKRGGAIVNIASLLATEVRKGFAAYGAAKASVVQITRVLALELARNAIRVNALAPGYIATDLTAEYFSTQAGQRMIEAVPMRRLGELRDLDGALLLLASDAGAYITGQSFLIDGGHSLVIP